MVEHAEVIQDTTKLRLRFQEISGKVVNPPCAACQFLELNADAADPAAHRQVPVPRGAGKPDALGTGREVCGHPGQPEPVGRTGTCSPARRPTACLASSSHRIAECNAAACTESASR